MSALLALDTATERTYAALVIGGRVWDHEGEGGAKASASLLPALKELLHRAGTTVQGLDAVGFGRGPGAFTGLRVACSIAQGLALAANCRVLPIDTLLAVAEDARQTLARGEGRADTAETAILEGEPDIRAQRMWALLDARMNEIYAAEYEHGKHGWSVISAPELLSVDVLNRRWQLAAPEVVAGNALSVFGDRLVTGAAFRLPEAAPRGAALMSLAQSLWTAGAGVDPALALPLYVRDKVADTRAERAARAVAAPS